MEAVRLLANDNFDAGSKISCILVGTGEFFAKLRMAINESLRQRITLFCNLRELSRPAGEEYPRHCLSDAGAEHPIFDPDAVQLICDVSGGAIRLVKRIAAAAMTALRPVIFDLNHGSFAAFQRLVDSIGEEQLTTTLVSLKIVCDDNDRRSIEFTPD